MSNTGSDSSSTASSTPCPRPRRLRDLVPENLEEIPEFGIERFRRQSPLMRYLCECEDHKKYPELTQYIQEQGAAHMKLLSTSMVCYERIASGMVITNEVGLEIPPYDSAPVFMFLTCGFSAVDSLAAILAAILIGEAPETEEGIAGVGNIIGKLKQKFGEGFPAMQVIANLKSSDWYSSLALARHRIVHRGFWPMRIHPHGESLMRREAMPGSGKDWIRPNKLEVEKIARGLLGGLEAWEVQLMSVLDGHQTFLPSPVARKAFHHFQVDKNAAFEMGGGLAFSLSC